MKLSELLELTLLTPYRLWLETWQHCLDVLEVERRRREYETEDRQRDHDDA